MSSFIIEKSQLKGKITIPPSKSQTLRAILFGSLANGKTIINDYLHSPDTAAMINACLLFGAKIDVSPSQLIINGLNGEIKHAEDVINAGNSGIVLRFISAIGSLSSNPVVITGDHSIRHQRPMKPLLTALNQLGVETSSLRGDGFAPVIIKGPIKSGSAYLSGQDSQPVSALLIAASMAQGPIEIIVNDPGEKPWVALTLEWLTRLGAKIENQNFEKYIVQGSNRFEGFNYSVPGDLSSAAFPIAAALVTQSDIIIENCDLNDSQGDKALIQVFQNMGANIDIDSKNKTLSVHKSNDLKGIEVDINDFIDSITLLATVACFAKTETRIRNAENARNKECNRISSISSELKKMGGNVEETSDGLIIRPKKLIGSQVYSHNDHRMAMSLAVAGLGAEGRTEVQSIECIAKTYPDFIPSFRSLGCNILKNGQK